MRRLALLLALCAAGCASVSQLSPDAAQDSNRRAVSRSGGGEQSRGIASGAALSKPGASRSVAAAPADSLTLRWTLPTRGAIGCWADPASRVYDRQRWSVLRLRGQAAAWRPGCEAVVACWDSVRAQTVPDTVMSQYGWPGDTIRVRVARGYEYTVVARNSRGWNCWGRIVR